MVHRTRYVIILVLVIIFSFGMGVEVVLDTDFGNLNVEVISVPYGNLHLSGLLYRPHQATAETPLPGVVLVHGISSSKQFMSSIALELARHGVVSLAIDIIGHGDSEGVFGNSSNDITFGTMTAVRYLESQKFVNASLIGLVGHSLGAGAVRATAVAQGNISALVFIGGGLGENVETPDYGAFNTSFPRNLLVAIGSKDVLFDMASVKNDLAPAFGIWCPCQEIAFGSLYGDFSLGTARKLIAPPTTHLFEIYDPTIISETVQWMDSALKAGDLLYQRSQPNSLTYIYREVAISISLVAFICLIFPLSLIISENIPFQNRRVETNATSISFGSYKTLLIAEILGLVLVFPLIAVGSFVPFPPLLLGSGFVWWLFVVGLLGLLIMLFRVRNFSIVSKTVKLGIRDAFGLPSFVTALVVFALLYLVDSLVEAVFVTELRIVIPIFHVLSSLTRALLFPMLLPFFFVFFLADGMLLDGCWPKKDKVSGFKTKFFTMTKFIIVKNSPYLGLLCLQYLPMFLLNIRLLTGSLGFLTEFFWGIIPLFIISSAINWWFRQNTTASGTAIILNSLLFAWAASSVFALR